jgi:hypothetical protein
VVRAVTRKGRVNNMYRLTVTQKNKSGYDEKITCIFDDFNDMVTFMEVSLKKSELPVKVEVELTEKEGDQNDGN